jgi:hypothetical protein
LDPLFLAWSDHPNPIRKTIPQNQKTRNDLFRKSPVTGPPLCYIL